jgi:ribonuclease T2
VSFGRLARLTFAALALLLSVSAARAEGLPGRFDHYVLSLSWSPTYCEAQGRNAKPAQCARARPFAFVVHGLWPQYERGWPEDCQNPAPFVPEQTVRGMLELMPSRRLVIHEWRKHGTCSGLTANAYFDKVRQARAGIVIPDQFARIDNYRMVSPSEVEAAFRAANPGLQPDMISVDCDGRRLTEVKICMNRQLGFVGCEEVDRRACRVQRIVMPPMRGG